MTQHQHQHTLSDAHDDIQEMILMTNLQWTSLTRSDQTTRLSLMQMVGVYMNKKNLHVSNLGTVSDRQIRRDPVRPSPTCSQDSEHLNHWKYSCREECGQNERTFSAIQIEQCLKSSITQTTEHGQVHLNCVTDPLSQ